MNAETPVPAKRKLGFAFMVVGMFMAILDIQIVAASSAEIGAGIGAGLDQISWVQTAYLVAEVVMIPLSGWLARALSTRWLFVISSAGFALSSLFCALAWNLESMIVFRAIQGFLGGAMIPTVFTASFTIFPKSQTAKVSVFIGLTATAAPTLGPALGGWLTQIASWEWLFLVNLLPGILVTLAVAATMDVDEPDFSLLRKIDFAGIALTAAFLGSLQYVLEEGPRQDWLEDSHVRFFALVAAAAGILFVRHMLYHPNRVVDLRAFADRNFATGSIFSFIIGAGLYGSVFLLPQFLSQVRGMNSLDIGLIMMGVGAFQMLSAPIAGALAQKLDPRIMLAAGLALFGFGLWLSAELTNQTGMAELLLPNAIRGLSLMLCFLPINVLALGTLPPERLKNASGLYNLMRNLGGAIALAALNTVLLDRGQMHQTHLAERLTSANPGVTEKLAGLAELLTPSLGSGAEAGAIRILGELVRRETLVLAYADAFMILAALFALALLLMPFAKKVAINGAAPEGH